MTETAPEEEGSIVGEVEKVVGGERPGGETFETEEKMVETGEKMVETGEKKCLRRGKTTARKKKK